MSSAVLPGVGDDQRQIFVARLVSVWPVYAALFLPLLAAGAWLRFWALSARPGWQYDEGVYTGVARNLLQHGHLTEHITYGAPYSPFLYQPPFYFEVLDRWFAATGPSIYHARILGVLFSLVTVVLLFALIWRLHGHGAALVAMLPITLDGWLLYIQRISYIENLLLALIVAGLLLYQFALASGHWGLFAAAGVVLGFAAAFKYTGVYAVAAVLLCWLILSREHRGHLVLLGFTAATIIVYLLVMVKLYDAPGHPWFEQQSLVQVRRVLGLQSSGGTLTSPVKALHLLVAEYRVFLPSFLIAVASFALAARRLWHSYRARDWAPLRGNALLFSWLAAAVVIFGFSSLRFPQYFALILVPMYGFFWTEVWCGERSIRFRAALTLAAAALGLVSFWLRIGGYDDNTFAQVQRYAAASIPRHAVVVADEAIGDLISQPYCREQDATPCLHRANYVITWDTYLQKSAQLGDPAFHELMRNAHQTAVWTGFNGTLTVYRLGAPVAPVTAGRPGRPAGNPVLGVDLYVGRGYPPALVARDGRRNLVYIKRVLHARSVGIVWNMYAATYRGDQVTHPGSLSISPAEVGVLTQEAEALGMSVEYRPLIRVGPGGHWEGWISPVNRAAWFHSLYQADLPYLRVAALDHVMAFVAGTELYSLARAPEWAAFLDQIRSVYHGAVTVASYQKDYVEVPQLLPPEATFGVDPYPSLPVPPSASIKRLVAGWDHFFKLVPAAVLAHTTLQEVGIPAQVGAYAHPSKWGLPGTPDPQVQARYFTAVCRVVQRFHMQGVYFYEVNLTDNPARPSAFPAFFEGKPASVRAIRGCGAIFSQ